MAVVQIPDTRLWVGDEDSCRGWDGAILHACKDPCYTNARGVKKTDPTDPQYLAVERDSGLFLNIIDPPIPLFKRESFDAALNWLSCNYENEDAILIHCNLGASRSPSIAMLFMTKRLQWQPLFGIQSFNEGHRAFARIYPNYQPGKGISTFLSDHWSEIQ